MDTIKKNQFIEKFKPIGKNLNILGGDIWNLRDIFMFMKFDFTYYKFKKFCKEHNVKCKEERNLNSINHEKYFMNLEFDKSDFAFYNSLNDNTQKTILKQILR